MLVCCSTAAGALDFQVGCPDASALISDRGSADNAATLIPPCTRRATPSGKAGRRSGCLTPVGGAGLDPGKLLMVIHLGPLGGNCNTIAEGTRGVGPDCGLPFATCAPWVHIK